jgi:hypothetical protein
MAFNRNIITEEDVTNFTAAESSGMNFPATLAESPPAPASVPVGPAAPPPGAPNADDYFTRLVKYVPLEIIGFYLLVAGLIDSNVEDDSTHALALGLLLVGSVILAALFSWFKLNVRRVVQIVMIGIALLVYVFAAGGWFATTTWYDAWLGTVAVAVFGVLVKIVGLPALPTES